MLRGNVNEANGTWRKSRPIEEVETTRGTRVLRPCFSEMNSIRWLNESFVVISLSQLSKNLMELEIVDRGIGLFIAMAIGTWEDSKEGRYVMG